MQSQRVFVIAMLPTIMFAICIAVYRRTDSVELLLVAAVGLVWSVILGLRQAILGLRPQKPRGVQPPVMEALYTATEGVRPTGPQVAAFMANHEFENPTPSSLHFNEGAPRYAFIDTDNNIIRMISYGEALDDKVELQRQFDKFVTIVEQQGTMSLCVGNVFLVEVRDMRATLHMKEVPQAGKPGHHRTYWEVRRG